MNHDYKKLTLDEERTEINKRKEEEKKKGI